MGVEKTVILTGDSQVVARSVAHQLGLDGFIAELLPEEKVDEIEKLLARSGKAKLVFVGDGINDALLLRWALLAWQHSGKLYLQMSV